MLWSRLSSSYVLKVAYTLQDFVFLLENLLQEVGKLCTIDKGNSGKHLLATESYGRSDCILDKLGLNSVLYLGDMYETNIANGPMLQADLLARIVRRV